ncbi:unnamed protein product [Arabis nemorensis]|uniref:DUF4219 domain-containing protein n=1 Tax=Arabis nemorensis TaxID=586526 RepID=A0A565BPD3_9BRAS|nr:unnamed protein product [Arabis nemorensis]
MADFTTSIEKLNNNNYGSWSTRMKFYLLGQDLWDIVNGAETTPPREARSTYTTSDTSTSTPVKSLCDEISKLDPENGITQTRMKRIIIHGLKPEYKSIITATRGWATEPTLADLENLLINEEDLDKSTLSGPTNGEETALFTNRRSMQGELVELKIIMVVRTDGNKIIIKAMNVTIAARRDIMQGIAGPRKLKEMLQHLQGMKEIEKKIGNLKLLFLWRK